MKEADLIRQHRDHWLKKSPDAFYYKIPDVGAALGNKKPFDVFILDNGRSYAKEFKLHKSLHAWPISKLKDHQVEGLWKAHMNGAEATLFVGVRVLLSPRERDRLELPVRRIAIDLEFPIVEVVKWQEQEVKSVTVIEKVREQLNGSS